MLRLTLGLLVYERELVQIGKRLQIAGLDARFVERSLVPDGVVVGVLQHRLQTIELQLLKLGTGHALDLRVVILLRCRNVLCHFCSLISAHASAVYVVSTRSGNNAPHVTTAHSATQYHRISPDAMLGYCSGL